MVFLQDSTSTYVKICGLMDEECLDVAIGSGADAIGFVFVPNSPRQISRELAGFFDRDLRNSASDEFDLRQRVVAHLQHDRFIV